MPSSQQMQVKVIDSLTSLCTSIDDQPVALRQILLSGDLSGGSEQMAEQSCIFCTGVRQRAKVLLGNDKNVDRGLRAYVWKGEDLLVFK